MIAAAGTGGHVFPGLSVGEALIDLGVARSDIMFVGGSRLEAKVYPKEGFPFLQVEIRGLQRSLTLKNFTLPRSVIKARNRIYQTIQERNVRAVLGMGGYATVSAGLAARRAQVPFLNSEQNAEAGLANRITARWAARSFVSFPETVGLPNAEWVGNPVRQPFWSFDRVALRSKSIAHFGLSEGVPVLGVFGGSLGAGSINDAVLTLASRGVGRPLQIVHLTGEQHLESIQAATPAEDVTWTRIGFEQDMEMFYATSDLVLARAGGAVAELTATATPSILVPGDFGSSGHQGGNARFLTNSGAAFTLPQAELSRLGDVVIQHLFDHDQLDAMRVAAGQIARPDAARVIAQALLGAR
jgi:UDP-N-acetylglucosamine--N-acetylmuramyl-(pentapeptide) pyrophosphoryl-undecaprenol N-acetylglucosamine transferase